MAIRSVMLINESRAPLTAERLQEVARALQVQVVRDLQPVWDVTAYVGVAHGSDLTEDTWPIRIVDHAAQLGVHLTDGRPEALVEATEDWSVTASHELLEMLVDPWGKKLEDGLDVDPKHAGRPVKYLVEVCDPCQVYDYTIDGVAVSDFVTRQYYDRAAQAGVRVDYLGRLKAPFNVPRGCTLSWRDHSDSRWHQWEPDGDITRDAESRNGHGHRGNRDAALAGRPGADRHDLQSARLVMSRDVTEAALKDLLSNDPRMQWIIRRARANHGWTDKETEDATTEYQRYLLLRYLYPNNRLLALDERADKLWHHHILDTMKYRADCERIFGKMLDHQPFYEAPKDEATLIEEFKALYWKEFRTQASTRGGRTCI
jgi:hypothetical protein